MGLVVLGVNHKSASLDVRSRFALTDIQTSALINCLNSEDFINGVVIVSTCNRVEFYIETKLIKSTVILISELMNFNINDIRNYSYVKYGQQSELHLFNVASGLDSMVVGENEILGQLKSAFSKSLLLKATGTYLHKLFEHSFSVAKNVRTKTAINDNSLSIPAIAVKYILQIYNDLTNKNVLIIGTGDMAKKVMHNILPHKCKKIFVMGRSIYKSSNLIEKVAAKDIATPVSMQQLREVLPQVDIVISQTSSPYIIINSQLLVESLDKKKSSPFICVDLAVPRDIDAAVTKIDRVYLYSVDDLNNTSLINASKRNAATSSAIKIIKEEVNSFRAKQISYMMAPTISRLKNKAEDFRVESVTTANKMLKKGYDPEFVVEYLSKLLTNKILHTPIVNIKTNSSKSLHDKISTIEEIFNLE